MLPGTGRDKGPRPIKRRRTAPLPVDGGGGGGVASAPRRMFQFDLGGTVPGRAGRQLSVAPRRRGDTESDEPSPDDLMHALVHNGPRIEEVDAGVSLADDGDDDEDYAARASPNEEAFAARFSAQKKRRNVKGRVTQKKTAGLSRTRTRVFIEHDTQQGGAHEESNTFLDPFDEEEHILNNNDNGGLQTSSPPEWPDVGDAYDEHQDGGDDDEDQEQFGDGDDDDDAQEAYDMHGDGRHKDERPGLTPVDSVRAQYDVLDLPGMLLNKMSWREQAHRHESSCDEEEEAASAEDGDRHRMKRRRRVRARGRVFARCGRADWRCLFCMWDDDNVQSVQKHMRIPEQVQCENAPGASATRPRENDALTRLFDPFDDEEQQECLAAATDEVDGRVAPGLRECHQHNTSVKQACLEMLQRERDQRRLWDLAYAVHQRFNANVRWFARKLHTVEVVVHVHECEHDAALWMREHQEELMGHIEVQRLLLYKRAPVATPQPMQRLLTYLSKMQQQQQDEDGADATGDGLERMVRAALPCERVEIDTRAVGALVQLTRLLLQLQSKQRTLDAATAPAAAGAPGGSGARGGTRS